MGVNNELWRTAAWGGNAFPGWINRLAAGCLLMAASVAAFSQAPPQLVSVTPADGATGVNTNASIVFVFNEDMNTTVTPFGTIPGAFVGNFEVPSTLGTFTGTWAADKRTLTLKPVMALPFEAEVPWTLNPPGASLFPKFSSAAGVELPTLSGSFQTTENVSAGPPPGVVSVTPASGATGVAPDSALVFTFDRPMDTNVIPISSFLPAFVGNYSIQPASISFQFQGTWGADQQTLTLRPFGSLPAGTLVSWTLNPDGANSPFKSAAGRPLPTVSGTYQVLGNAGGNTNEICTATNLHTALYSLFKQYYYHQESADLVRPSGEGQFPFVFMASVFTPPPTRPATEGSLTFPNGTTVPLTNQAGSLIQLGYPAEAADFEAAYPAGNYVLRFNRSGGQEHAINMNMPARPEPMPAILNYAEAQAIDASAPFTVRWPAQAQVSDASSISLSITDAFGNLMFTAPNPCVPRELAPSASSIVIPANYLRPGERYTGTLMFGRTFYFSTNAVEQMTGSGAVIRSTQFTIRTLGGGSGEPTIDPARFLEVGLENSRPRLTISGTAGQVYTIQRATSLENSSWQNAGEVTMSGTGEAIFQDSSAVSDKVFYRVVTE